MRKKHTIEFLVKDSYDEDELNTFLRGADWKIVVEEIDKELRREIKYASDNVSEETITALEKIRKFLYEELSFRNLSLS